MFPEAAPVLLLPIALAAALAAAAEPPKPLSDEERKELRAEWRKLNTAGMEAYQQGDRKKAKESFEKALSAARRLYPKDDFPDGHENLTVSLNNLAEVLAAQGKAADAEPLHREALAVTRRLFPERAHPAVARSLNNLAHVLVTQGKVAAAEPLYREALETNRRLFPEQDHPVVASSLSSLAEALREQGKWADAEPLLREALAMQRRLYPRQDLLEVARNLNSLAGVLEAEGKWADAEPLRREVLDVLRRLYPKQDLPGVAECLFRLAAGLHTSGKLADAEPLFRDALAMEQRLHPKQDHPHVANNLFALATVLHQLGKTAEAEPLFRDALAMRRRLLPNRDHPLVADNLNDSASVLFALGKPADAEPLLRDALAMSRRLHPERDHPAVAQSLSNLGAVLSELNKPADAEPLLRDALAMLRRLHPEQDHPNVAGCMSKLAAVLRDLGKPADAEPFARNALAMQQRLYPKQDHPDVARTLLRAGVTLLAQNKAADAEPLFRGALAMNRRLASGLAGQKSEGDVLSYASFHCSYRDGYISTALAAGTNSAVAYQEVFPDRGAVARVYEQRQLQARAAASDPKAGKLLGELADARIRRAELLLAPRTKDEGTLKKRREEIAGYEKAIADTDKALRGLFPPVERLDRLNKATPADLQKILPAEVAVVDYLRWTHFEYDPKKPGKDGETRTANYLAFVVTRSDIKWVHLGTAKEIEPAVAGWREAVTANDPKAAELGAAVRELVWARVRKELPANTKTVYLCPDRDLCRLPFAALPGDQPGTVLLDDFALAAIPHAPFLLDRLWPQDERKNPPTGVLAVGGVRYDAEVPAPPPADAVATRGPLLDPKKTPKWDPLPATAGEVEAVAKIAGTRKLAVDTLTGEKATPAAVLAALPKAKYAHLATHGFFADRQFRSAFDLDEGEYARTLRGERVGRAVNSPLVMTGLVLAGANRPATPGRGIVTGEALVDLDLSGLDLAVLSACETGLGDDVTAGEGTFGLQRAFHYAGTRNVVASLWKVNDTATAALMGEFYRQLWDLNRPPIEALRQAQLAVYRADGKRFTELARRGFGAGDKDVSKLPVAADATGRQPPSLWAAFTLSGYGR